MEYHESADYLQSLQRRRPKLGTDTTARMLAHLGDPDNSFDSVQIAGSNGKGSTAQMTESVLRAAGLDVGLFTSPGLNGFREQVTVNGGRIPKERVTEFVEQIEPCIDRLAAEDDKPTHFEVLTALALYHFDVEDVDVAVLEVGIGGRYDATSAVDPVASAVTSISLEHTDLLGDTIEEIALDKAQVAPGDAPLVTGTTGAALDAIEGITDTITVGGEAADVTAVENGMRSAVENRISLTGPDWALESNLKLLGQHQAENAGVAATLARQLTDVDTETISEGLRAATLPGRFEVRSTDPMVVLDGSHNPGAMATLATLIERYDYDDLHVVFAAMEDKEYEQMIATLPAVETAFAARPKVDRAASTESLAAAFEGQAAQVQRVESVPEATERAIAAADADDFVLVAGSLYAVAEARDRWSRLVVPGDNLQQASTGETAKAGSEPEIHQQMLSVTLRRDQAGVLKQELEDCGGTCTCSTVGMPEKLVDTTLSGTPRQFQQLTDRLASTGLGLGRLATQLEGTLSDRSFPPPFDREEAAVMGILNVTPDSFYDGGEYNRRDLAVSHAEQMIESGADIIDIGGESTRPGADPVSVETEIDRVVPVIEAVSSLDATVSVDTRKAAVADAALDAGADIVNDVSGLSDPEMRFVVADHDASVILMHSLSAPVDPGRTVTYDDVVDDVLRDLTEQILLAEQAGIDREQIIVDPGCGFGKNAAESFELVDRLHEFHALGCPVLVGHSRKSMFADMSDAGADRLPPTLATTALAAERGADAVRVHDVSENNAVLKTVSATASRPSQMRQQ
ncbi:MULTISPECIES: dihydropteroate synthase [unclassified Haloarcula]|uniref:dihydropteroate synthase n=1 Tax=unclassified Haloarcula TaxID=2624677 RepID=UPI00059555B9|nr:MULTISPECIES: dihydropteroate synthase [unclassified Haloarcula]AJF27503.1 dihydropteroate synthase [Haloarcula sp. CBA1115]KAA9404227.1 dihydropteroate synthase [Haloarcula sp. CBA1131]MUV48310.1 dihydropteroate synthase [Haloarcula sp. CBA1122]